jgi:hypothetical protein
MFFSDPLKKANKLKRFGNFVSESMRKKIDVEGMNPLDVEMSRIDCLHNGDIYTRRDLREKLLKIATCASIVEVRKYDTGETRIHNANWCQNPVVCPVCANRVSRRRRAIFSEPIRRAVRRYAVDKACGDWKIEYPRDYSGVYMLTATIKDVPVLRQGIDMLQDSLLNMRKMGQKRKGKRSRGEWSKVRAFIQNIEVKRGSGSGLWHVHAHILAFTDAPIDITTRGSKYYVKKTNGEAAQISKFSYEWYRSTGGTAVNFSVIPVGNRSDVHGTKGNTFAESVQKQASEVLKYTAQLSIGKGLELLTAAQYVELIQRRGNRRLFNTGGGFRCDKRNQESLMTISDRELRRLEYVDEMDKKHYEVYASMWQRGGAYSEMVHQDGAIFKNSDDMATNWINIRRRAWMAQTAIYQGAYRKTRNGLFKTRVIHSDKNVFEALLDKCRDEFRNQVSALWEKLTDRDYLPDFLCDFNSTGMQGFKEKYLHLLPVASLRQSTA